MTHHRSILVAYAAPEPDEGLEARLVELVGSLPGEIERNDAGERRIHDLAWDFPAPVDGQVLQLAMIYFSLVEEAKATGKFAVCLGEQFAPDGQESL